MNSFTLASSTVLRYGRASEHRKTARAAAAVPEGAAGLPLPPLQQPAGQGQRSLAGGD